MMAHDKELASKIVDYIIEVLRKEGAIAGSLLAEKVKKAFNVSLNIREWEVGGEWRDYYYSYKRVYYIRNFRIAVVYSFSTEVASGIPLFGQKSDEPVVEVFFLNNPEDVLGFLEVLWGYKLREEISTFSTYIDAQEYRITKELIEKELGIDLSKAVTIEKYGDAYRVWGSIYDLKRLIGLE